MKQIERLQKSDLHKESGQCVALCIQYKEKFGKRIDADAAIRCARVKARLAISIEWVLTKITGFHPKTSSEIVDFAESIEKKLVQKGMA